MSSAASQEYQARLTARRADREALTTADARLARARLATFFAGIVVALLVWRSGASVWWLLAPVAVFAWLVRHHARVLRARELAVRGIAFYERGVARLEDRWPGTGEAGERFRDDLHLYANDLDLFGRGSLFELLSLARTTSGEAMLAGWLTVPADPSAIQARDSGRGACLEAGSPGAARARRCGCASELGNRSTPRLGRVVDTCTADTSSRRLVLHSIRARGNPVPGAHVGVVAAGSRHGVRRGGATLPTRRDECDPRRERHGRRGRLRGRHPDPPIAGARRAGRHADAPRACPL